MSGKKSIMKQHEEFLIKTKALQPTVKAEPVSESKPKKETEPVKTSQTEEHAPAFEYVTN